MGLGSIGAAIGAIDALVQLGISEILAADLRKFLSESATDLTDSAPDNVGGNAFGHAPASLQLASDASKARTHVADALKDMAAGLEGYGEVVTTLYRNSNEIDLTTQQQIHKQNVAVDECFRDFAAPSQCGLPGSSTEDN